LLITPPLLRAVEDAVPAVRARAAALDDAACFPHEDFEALRALGVLRATLPVRDGGLGFGAGDGADLCRLLALLGEGNLAVARLYEAHVNALHLIFRYGSAALAHRAALDAGAGHLFALWVTDPPGESLRWQCGALVGQKYFCSGAGVATRVLTTAATPAGTQMMLVELPALGRVVPGAVGLSGMRAAVTGAYDFTGLAAEFVGRPGDYLAEPVFSAGAWRAAAAAFGGVTALLNLHRAEILRRHRECDPHQRARFGQAVIAHETARLWIFRAAARACREDGPADEIVAYVNAARLAVEQACLTAITLAQRSIGLAAFAAGAPLERVARDLQVFLRQPAPDETLDRAAEFFFGAGLPA
jgi:alkylation response protein AidB-like acyl-CoA dehydrogenase